MKNIQNTLDEMKATLKTPLEPGKSQKLRVQSLEKLL